MGHLDESGVGYFRHWLFAFQFGLVMILVGMCILVHAFFPWWFQTTGSDAIRAMGKALEDGAH